MHVSVIYSRAIGAGSAGVAAAGPKFGQKVAGVYGGATPLIMREASSTNSSISTQIAPETISGGLKCKTFLGEECPQTP